MTLSKISFNKPDQEYSPVFDVIAYAHIIISIPGKDYGYLGRGHSLWYCDALEKNRYGWYEMAFMLHPVFTRPTSSQHNPFWLKPNLAAEVANLGVGVGTVKYQLAWPFERLELGNLEEFIDRWISWFADAVMGNLHDPSNMPERDPSGSWRKD